MNIYLGVDPGMSGALAWLTDDGGGVCDMQTAGKDLNYLAIANWLVSAQSHGPARAVIEHVSAMPKQGVSSTFRFGAAFGAVVALVASRCIPYELVRPHQWRVKMVGRGASKDDARQKAIRLFPWFESELRRKKDHGRAEALLLAEYGRRYVWQGELVRPETVEDMK